MKTTVDLPEDLLIEAKKFAVEKRVTLRALIERGLRQQLATGGQGTGAKRKIRWVTVEGGAPAGVDLSDRETMMDFLRNDRD
jgi:hypothetical protein